MYLESLQKFRGGYIESSQKSFVCIDASLGDVLLTYVRVCPSKDVRKHDRNF